MNRRDQDMRITDLKTTILDAHWGAWQREWLLFRIDTDEGISGLGEAFGPAETVKPVLMAMKPLLVGEEPRDVERLFRKMLPGAYAAFEATHFDGGVAVHAASGIETALWDIAGKAAGLPIYRLLGGKHRDSIRLYSCAGGLDTYLRNREAHRELGITLLKFGVVPTDVQDVPGALMDLHLTRKGLKRLVALLEETREKVGEEVEIAVEGRFATITNAMRLMAALEGYGLAWVEDVLPPTDVGAWAQITASFSTPTLIGEGLHLRQEFKPFFDQQGMRIAAPDFQVCGGLSEGKKIAEMADLAQMLVAPHNVSSAIGIAAAVQACAAIPNLLALEFHLMPGWDRILRPGALKIQDGCISVPDGPGLGVELDEDEARKYARKGEGFFD